MRTIHVTVTGMFIQKDDKNGGVQGEGNATQLHIVFDTSWQGYGKRIIWRDAYGENPVAVDLTPTVEGLLDGDTLTFDTPIPSEPLARPGWCTFTIDGYQDGDPAAVALTVSDTLKVWPNDTDYEPAEPTPSQAQQILAAIEQIVPDMQEIATEAKSWAVGGTNTRTGEDTDNSKYYSEQSAASAVAAASSAEDAEDSAEEAANSASAAASSATAAANSAGAAADSAAAASSSATAAGTSAGLASDSEDAAKAAQAAAEAAQGKAEDAQTAAETAQGKAESAETGAEAAKTATESARDAAIAAQTAAETAKDSAEAYNTSAGQSASTAATEAENASESAIKAESWAIGGTGTRDGEDTNNAKYWSTIAQFAAGGGVTAFNGRSGAVVPLAGDYDAAMVGAIPSNEKGAISGVATLDASGKLVQDIDCGVWDTDPVAAHNATAETHANMLVDGNATAVVDTSATLEEHIANPNAHQNLVIDGNAGQ